MLLMRKNNHLTRKIYHFYKVTDKNISIFISFNSFFTYVFQYTSLTMRCCPRRTDFSLPCHTSLWQKSLPFFGRNNFPQRHFDFFRVFYIHLQAQFCLHRRMQCVSVTIAGFSKTSPIIRFALFRPTPGNFNNSSKSSGTLQSYLFTEAFSYRH